MTKQRLYAPIQILLIIEFALIVDFLWAILYVVNSEETFNIMEKIQMNKIIKIVTLILISTMQITNANQSIISKIYCKFLGNEDVHAQYKEKVAKALTNLGLEDPSDITVKQMNKVGHKLARIDLSSFTAFGIWLNEEYFNQLSDEKLTFQIYHEAAHYIKKHHQKLLLGGGAFVVLTALGLKQINNLLSSSKPIIKNSTVIGTGILTTAICCRYLLPYIIKQQEKQADLLAATTLIASGNQHVVQAHIENLKASNYPDENDLWWYSDREQIKYLESIQQI